MSWLDLTDPARCDVVTNAAKGKRLTRPVEVVTGVLIACLERGCLRTVPLAPSDLTALVRCIVPTLDPAEALTFLATALWATLQVNPWRGLPDVLLVS